MNNDNEQLKSLDDSRHVETKHSASQKRTDSLWSGDRYRVGAAGLSDQYKQCEACGQFDPQHSDDCEIMLDLEQWALSDKRSREKSRAVAGKQPRSLPEAEEEYDEEEPMSGIMDEHNSDMDDVEEEQNPDLRVFFERFALDAQTQIALCRTHANHLAAMLRAKSSVASTTPEGSANKKSKK